MCSRASGRADERVCRLWLSFLDFTRKSKHLRRKPKLANRAHVDQTMLYRLIIHNVQPGQRATGPLARSQCDAPLFAPGPQYRRHQSTPRRRAPQRLSPRTQHRGVLGSHPGGPRPDCGAAVCTHGANRARQQSARASQCECRDCKDGQRHAKPIGKGGGHPSGKGASSSGMRWSAPVPGRPSTRARPRWRLAAPPCRKKNGAEEAGFAPFRGVLCAC